MKQFAARGIQNLQFETKKEKQFFFKSIFTVLLVRRDWPEKYISESIRTHQL